MRIPDEHRKRYYEGLPSVITENLELIELDITDTFEEAQKAVTQKEFNQFVAAHIHGMMFVLDPNSLFNTRGVIDGKLIGSESNVNG